MLHGYTLCHEFDSRSVSLINIYPNFCGNHISTDYHRFPFTKILLTGCFRFRTGGAILVFKCQKCLNRLLSSWLEIVTVSNYQTTDQLKEYNNNLTKRLSMVLSGKSGTINKFFPGCGSNQW